MNQPVKKSAVNAQDDEMSAEELAEAFSRIKDPEVRASIIALVKSVAQSALPPGKH